MISMILKISFSQLLTCVNRSLIFVYTISKTTHNYESRKDQKFKRRRKANRLLYKRRIRQCISSDELSDEADVIDSIEVETGLKGEKAQEVLSLLKSVK